jgi:hypothetical protein
LYNIHYIEQFGPTTSYATLQKAWDLCLWLQIHGVITEEQTRYWNAVEAELDSRDKEEMRRRQRIARARKSSQEIRSGL